MRPTSALLLCAAAAACLLTAAEAYPQGYQPEPVYGYQPAPRQSYGSPIGRVKIQAYRGPSKGYGYDSFAPWGYYVTQPEDDKAYGYH